MTTHADFQLLEQLFEFCAIKDLKSRYLHMSPAMTKLVGYQKEEEIVGTDDYALKCPAVASAETFIAQDAWVTQTQNKMMNLDIHEYADGIHMLFTRKTPYFKKEELLGSLFGCVEWTSAAMMQLASVLTEWDQLYYPKRQKGRSYQMSAGPYQDQLSPREMDCLFYLLRNKTAKEIAKRLNLSYRTVEWHIANIRMKFQCATKTEIIEQAVSNGYLHYVPQHLLTTPI